MGSSFRQTSVPSLWHFEADPDAWIRKVDYRFGSGSCFIRHWLPRRQRKKFLSFFAWYIYISLQRSHKTVDIKAFLNFLLFGGRIWIRTDNNYRSGSGSGSRKHKSDGSGFLSVSGTLRQTSLTPKIFTCVRLPLLGHLHLFIKHQNSLHKVLKYCMSPFREVNGKCYKIL
jgi:hypothetical protein